MREAHSLLFMYRTSAVFQFYFVCAMIVCIFGNNSFSGLFFYFVCFCFERAAPPAPVFLSDVMCSGQDKEYVVVLRMCIFLFVWSIFFLLFRYFHAVRV